MFVGHGAKGVPRLGWSFETQTWDMARSADDGENHR